MINERTPGSVTDQTYRFYLDQLRTIRFEGKEDLLGITLDGGTLSVPYFGRTIRLTGDGLVDESGRRPDFADCVVLCRYLIMCPPFEPEPTSWTAFRDFPDAGPLTVFWADTVEGVLARAYSGHVAALEKACDNLGGRVPETDVPCDLCRRFTPLPKVPLLLVFHDADDDFPAAASLLFEKRASVYLDGESQAILGRALSLRLTAGLGG